jgi:phage terminase Nu1 subunit (DNA packaging protein)
MDHVLLATYPLPEGVSDADVNRGQLAQAFGVSTNTVDKWRVDGMPVEQEGTNGQSYVFRLSHCWAWREARQADSMAARASGDQAAHQLRMHFLNLQDNEPRGHLTAEQRIREAEAEMKYNLAARARRELIHSAEVELILSSMASEFRAALQNLPDWAEREFGLSHLHVAKMTSYCDEVLTATANQIEAQHLLADSQNDGYQTGRLAL